MSKSLPTRIKILAWGANESDRGTFLVDAATAECLRAQIAKDAYAKLVIDFDHQSEEGSGSYKESPRHHAGYGDLEVVEGDGVYLAGIEWTDAGREYAFDYKDLSPSIEYDDDRRVVRITSVALVPNGALKGRTLFAARKDNLGNDAGSENKKEKTMESDKKDEKPENTATPEPKAPEAPAGGPPATPAEGTPPAPPAEEKKETLDAGTGALEAKIAALEASLAELKGEIAQLRKPPEKPAANADQLAALEKRTLVRFAVLEGKAVTLPESVLEKMSVKETVEHLAALRPGTLPVQSVIPRGAGGGTAAAPNGTSRAELVAKYQAKGMDFERAWNTARGERPDLF